MFFKILIFCFCFSSLSLFVNLDQVFNRILWVGTHGPEKCTSQTLAVGDTNNQEVHPTLFNWVVDYKKLIQEREKLFRKKKKKKMSSPSNNVLLRTGCLDLTQSSPSSASASSPSMKSHVLRPRIKHCPTCLKPLTKTRCNKITCRCVICNISLISQ